MLNLTCFVAYCHDKKKKCQFVRRGGGGKEGGGAFDIRGWRGAGVVVHKRESADFRSPEVDISATFTHSENIQSQKTVTSLLVYDCSRVGGRNLQT